MILIISQKGINEVQTLCVGSNAVECITICYVIRGWLTETWFNLIDLCSNLVPAWACNIQFKQFLQHTSFKIGFVRASNSMDQMLICYIVVFWYLSIIWCSGFWVDAFATCGVPYLTIFKLLALINGSLFHIQSCCSLPIGNIRRVMSERSNQWLVRLPDTTDRGVDTTWGCNWTGSVSDSVPLLVFTVALYRSHGILYQAWG